MLSSFRYTRRVVLLLEEWFGMVGCPTLLGLYRIDRQPSKVARHDKLFEIDSDAFEVDG